MIDVIVSLEVSWSSRDDVDVNLLHRLPCIWSILHTHTHTHKLS